MVKTEQGHQLGVSTEQGIFPSPLELSDIFADMDAGLRGLSRFAQQYNGELLGKGEDLRFGPCVPNPGKIICVGLNYRKHAEESHMDIPNYPVLFNKFSNSIAAHKQDIELPRLSSQIDYEAELAIVIGKKAKNIKKDEALDYVLGYCVANDLSARDLQMRTSQWMLGKCCDGFSPIGPYLVTAGDIENPNNLRIRLYVNGDLRQDSNTSDMIFKCDYIVSYISQYMTLMPGDIILTGTPEGVILGYPEERQVWLKDGDVVDVEIEKLGRLTNRVKEVY
ncbi:fumarylacetoacetate hydrolase family protein [Alicyclobacillus suci]|uniref:fumarylacetoacetate hydrolase family protein n=1 Tax=Alicyclobacillus suci TaxID=2816080 RepID=UPI001CB78770|nr:fumarylacetoacetate hydrolase family protein [Alicyclobacillus suci]